MWRDGNLMGDGSGLRALPTVGSWILDGAGVAVLFTAAFSSPNSNSHEIVSGDISGIGIPVGSRAVAWRERACVRRHDEI